MACSSNDLETVKVYLQTGVYTELKNTRGHRGEDLTSNSDIGSLLRKCRETTVCSITKTVFQDLQIKYFCLVCEQFFNKDATVLEWCYVNTEDELNYYPECRCLNCHKIKVQSEVNLKSKMEQYLHDHLN